MSTRKRKRTAEQDALIKLRTTLNMTQQEFSQALGVALVSVARWESSRPPSGLSLAQLEVFAREKGHQEIAAVFRRASEKEERPQSSLRRLLPLDERALGDLRGELHYREKKYLDTEYKDWDEAEVALRRLRRLQAVYLGVLHALRKSYDVLLEEADEEQSKAWITTRGVLDWLITQERKKVWEQE